MNLHSTVLAILLALPFGVSAGAGELDPATQHWLEAAVAGEHRDPAKRARDQYRHPREVLAFFGLKPDSSVAEIWPSDGWWTEILAPALRDEGVYYAAGFAMTADRTPEWRKGVQKRFAEKLEAQPELYGRGGVDGAERTGADDDRTAGIVGLRGDVPQRPQLDSWRLRPRDVPRDGPGSAPGRRARPGDAPRAAGLDRGRCRADGLRCTGARDRDGGGRRTRCSKRHRRSTRIRGTRTTTRRGSGRYRPRSPCAARRRIRASVWPARAATARLASPTA